MRGIDIVGLTLAEIALVLLFCFLALFAPAYARLNKKAKAEPNSAETQRKLDAALRENQSLKLELDKWRDKRSKVTPSCVETGKTSGPLFTAVIRAEDRYEVNGQQFNLTSLLQHYSEAMTDARKSGCVHSIRVYYGDGVSLSDYDNALRRIEQSFYDTKLGAERVRQ